MIRTIKTSILFASTSLLALMGEDSIITHSIEAHSMNSQHTSVTESGTGEMETEWRELVTQNKLLFKRMVQDPNGVSGEDMRELVDKANDFYHKQLGYGEETFSLNEAWSQLTGTAEKARGNPHRYKKLLNAYDKSIGKIQGGYKVVREGNP
ncbi:hypothetical protein [Pasteuria penetrans]|uniref:hypothetical protein n=1 Tax=Pasteuria penetrans TaxID=86005 RepID=UPI000FBD9E6F|nr:hypothetical protein [Pasteuria penetrans]